MHRGCRNLPTMLIRNVISCDRSPDNTNIKRGDAMPLSAVQSRNLHPSLSIAFRTDRSIDMPRTKQVMKLVENGKKRELTHKKRLGSLVQKVSQLSTLCGIDVFLVCAKPGGGEPMTWPEDGDSLQEMVTRFRETPPERIKENLNPATYLQGELAKGQCKLVKARHSRLDDVLTQWDRHLDDLSLDGLNKLHQALGETLQRAQRRIAELGVISDIAAPERAQHGPAFPGNTIIDFDFSFPDASSSVAVGGGALDYYYLPRDIPPQPVPVQTPYLGFHMLPTGIAFGGSPLPVQMWAPPGFSFASAGGNMNMIDRLHYDAGNAANGSAAATDDLLAYHHDGFATQGQGFAAGAAYHYDMLAYGFDAGYDDLEPRGAGVWPLATPNNQVDAAAYQLQNDPVLWPDTGAGHLSLVGQGERSWLRRFHRRV